MNPLLRVTLLSNNRVSLQFCPPELCLSFVTHRRFFANNLLLSNFLFTFSHIHFNLSHFLSKRFLVVVPWACVVEAVVECQSQVPQGYQECLRPGNSPRVSTRGRSTLLLSLRLCELFIINVNIKNACKCFFLKWNCTVKFTLNNLKETWLRTPTFRRQPGPSCSKGG